jgi:hypothetical protein
VPDPVAEGQEFAELAQNDAATSGQVETPERSDSGGNALKDRMARRSDELQKTQAEWFGIPGWDDLLEVELRALSYGTSRRIQLANEKVRQPELKELYNLADQIVAATEGFREVLPADDAPSYRTLEDDWMDLARRLPDCPQDLTPRRAVLFLVGDKRLPFLIQEWGEWAKHVHKGVAEEVVRDFATTP